MYLIYIVTSSRNHCCRGNTIMRSVFTVVGVDVAVNSRKTFSIIMEIKQWVPFALLSNYKRFRNVVINNMCQILRVCAYSTALVTEHI
jgi:hypothetical protein